MCSLEAAEDSDSSAKAATAKAAADAAAIVFSILGALAAVAIIIGIGIAIAVVIIVRRRRRAKRESKSSDNTPVVRGSVINMNDSNPLHGKRAVEMTTDQGNEQETRMTHDGSRYVRADFINLFGEEEWDDVEYTSDRHHGSKTYDVAAEGSVHDSETAAAGEGEEGVVDMTLEAWFYADDDDDTTLHGPFSLNDMKEWLDDGHFEATDLIRHGRDGASVTLEGVLGSNVGESEEEVYDL
jgi:hypothetical protein